LITETKRFRAFATALSLCFFALPLLSQDVIVREQTAGQAITFEQYVIQTDSTLQVIIPFRIRYDFFVFTRTVTEQSSAYSAHGEVSVELIDSTGSSVARKIRQIDLTADDNTSSALKADFVQHLFSFQLPHGKYTIVFKADDKESRRQFVNDRKYTVLPSGTALQSGLIPVEHVLDSSFVLFNLGGDVLFSRNFSFLFLSAKQYTAARYSLFKVQLDDEEKESIESDIPVSIKVFGASILDTHANGQSVALTVRPGDGSNVHILQMDGQQLRQGRYELVLSFPDSTKITAHLGARWLDMPLTLTDLDAAIEPLQFIMTKADYTELRRGGRTARITKFEEFWKKKDTTPATAYNEVMHEFYRRADFAFAAFRTLKEMNGAVTDRGRIYLLYGKPSTTERQLAPNGVPKEIWKYNSLTKIFTFEDPSKQGNYKLAENK
jgi:GWxTD domain-containing protein